MKTLVNAGNFSYRVIITLVLGFLLTGPQAMAQGDPRSNVNLIGMTPDPADIPDTHYRQQNEPACAIRPGDSACIICAYNDYRAVELFGDAWEGVSQSCDAGDTWRSRLAPGHPLHPAPIAAEFAADPRLAAIPGMAIFNFIAGYRDSNVGVLGIQHWLEINKEDADHYEPGLQTYIADNGTEGRFLDKPDMLAVLDPASNKTITLTTEMENPDLGTITREFPAGTLYVAYAVFTGSSSVKVMIKTSNDWGRTWSNQAKKLSESQNEVSGISLTAVGKDVLAVWRRRGDNNDPDSIMYSVISNGGNKATKGEVLADLCVFDQPTLTGTEPLDLVPIPLVAFRTNDFPWTASDDSNFYVFYSDRGRTTSGACDVNAPPRIVMHHSANGLNWTNDGPIDPNPKKDDGTPAPNSFQFMPTAFGADGKVQVAWYDTRREECAGPFPFVADYDGICGTTSALIQRTVDIYTTTVTAGTLPPPPVRASQFSIVVDRDTDKEYETEASFANKKLFAQGNAPFLGDYIAIAARAFRKDSNGQWISNASANPESTEDFFVAWTDNRDVRGQITSIQEPLPFTYPPAATGTSVALDKEKPSDLSSTEQLLADNKFEPISGPPRDTTKTAEGIVGSDPGAGVCVPGEPATYERSRDSNIYGSLIKDLVRLYAPTPSKPLSGLQRSFVVALSNSDVEDHTYDLTIDPLNCSGNCTASFRQQPATPHNNPLLSEQVIVPAKSTLARTVFVSGTLVGNVKVDAYEAGTLISTIQLGNAPSMFDPENCANSDASCTVTSNELHNLELQTINANLLNANLLNANLLNSPLVDWAVDNGFCEAPATVGCVLEKAGQLLDPTDSDVVAGETNAALLNAALLNANLLNANLLNANLLNAALLNANLLNMPLDDSSAPALDPALVQAALAGGASATVGAVIEFAANPVNGVNAALLNAALLNANLLNANLLNANLLNANLLNAALLNANLLNANLLNANLLNPDVQAADLLNANLLNADLLNANLLNPTLKALAEEGGCCDHEAVSTIGSVIIYAVNNPQQINAALLNAALLNANLLNANLLNANLLNANLLNADLLNANLLNADLLNANLLNADLLNANLLNADLLNANLLNANLLNANLLNAAIADGETVTYDDYTYPITNNGNVTTAIDADITINAPVVTDTEGNPVMNVIGTKLMTWTANATPTVIDCVERVQLDTRVQSITTTDQSLEVATIGSPFEGDVSAIVAPGETVFVTLRVVGTPEQLKKVRVSGFTASSQAANCVTKNGVPVCDTKLNEGVEQILFADTTPPTLVGMPGNQVLEATSVEGAVLNVPYPTATDNVDINPTVSCGPAWLDEPPYVFPIGDVTLVSCSASDNAGNGVTEEFTVTVTDTTPPVISGVPASFSVEATSAAGAVASWTDPTATDNGGSASVSCSPLSGSTFSLGTTPVNCIADDGRGNTASAGFTVTVTDATPPTLSGVPASFSVEATSAAGAVATWTDPTATDNGGSASVSCSPLSGSTFALGTTPVNCIADDGRGNTASAGFTVTVTDATPPTLSGVPASFSVEATSAAGAVATWTDPTATDNGGSASVSCSPLSGSTFALGSNSVTCTADDGRGNTTSAGFTVTVTDTTKPELFGVPVSFSVEATSAAGAVATWTDPTATDNGGSASVSCAPLSGSTFSLGTTPVSCTADDGRGNTASAGFSVTVQDTTAPALPTYTNLIVQASSTAGTPVTWSEIATDIVDGSVAVSCLPASGFAFPIDTTSVSCSATDAATNTASATFDVTVEDTTAPVVGDITLPDDLNPNAPYPLQLAATDNTISVTWPITVTDADPDLAISCSIDGTALDQTGPLAFDGDQVTAMFAYDFPVGDTNVVCTATDSANGTSPPVTFTVTVVDVTPPTAPDRPLGDFTAIDATSPAGAVVNWDPVYSDDAVSGAIAADCLPTAGSTFPIGTTTVSCTATDGARLEGPATLFDVVVVDKTAPTLTVPAVPVVVVAGANGQGTYVLSGNVSASDIVDTNPIINCSSDPLTFGDHTVTCTATDYTGNVSTASYTITVTDESGPVITLNSPSPIFLEAGVQTYTEPGATALDNVDGDVTSRVVITGSVNTAIVGTYAISYNATDTHGNAAATVTRIVTVRDTTAPIITVPSSPVIITTATAPAQVNFSAQVSVFDAGYPSTTATCTPNSGSSFAFGDTTVKCNATDLASNKAIEKTFTVRVRYLYDIKLILSKGVTKAGSTMPLDWQYLSWSTGLPVDGSSIVPKVLWKEADGSCKAITGASSGEDSGSSNFRYSSSNLTWQYSWQTPGKKGNYILTVSPPGTGIGTNASTCVSLK